MNKLLKLDPSNTTLLAQKHNLLQKEIEETNNKLKVLKEANKKAGESVKNYDAWEKAYEPIRQEMEKTKNSISELKKKMKELEDVGDIDSEEYKKLQSELKESNSHLKELKKQARDLHKVIVPKKVIDQATSLLNESAIHYMVENDTIILARNDLKESMMKLLQNDIDILTTAPIELSLEEIFLDATGKED